MEFLSLPRAPMEENPISRSKKRRERRKAKKLMESATSVMVALSDPVDFPDVVLEKIASFLPLPFFLLAFSMVSKSWRSACTDSVWGPAILNEYKLPKKRSVRVGLASAIPVRIWNMRVNAGLMPASGRREWYIDQRKCIEQKKQEYIKKEQEKERKLKISNKFKKLSSGRTYSYVFIFLNTFTTLCFANQASLYFRGHLVLSWPKTIHFFSAWCLFYAVAAACRVVHLIYRKKQEYFWQNPTWVHVLHGLSYFASAVMISFKIEGRLDLSWSYVFTPVFIGMLTIFREMYMIFRFRDMPDGFIIALFLYHLPVLSSSILFALKLDGIYPNLPFAALLGPFMLAHCAAALLTCPWRGFPTYTCIPFRIFGTTSALFAFSLLSCFSLARATGLSAFSMVIAVAFMNSCFLDNTFLRYLFFM